MTDSELELAEYLFRHPPSAATGAELGLRLVAMVRELKSKLAEPVLVEARPLKEAPEIPSDALPTPPHTPKAKAAKK